MLSKVSWAWLIPPFLTALVTLAHPVIDPWHGGVEGLAPLVQSNTRWIAVHAALLVLFPLSALALSRPVSGIETTSARVARLMLAVFGVVYAGFDTYAGLATGTVVHYAQDLSAAEQTGVLLAVKGLFNGPIIGVLYIVGTAAWMLGAGAVAFTLWRTGAPLAPVLLIAAAGLLLFADHTPPFGPITLGAVAVALGLLGWQSLATIREKV